jgi:cholesterol oxidase
MGDRGATGDDRRHDFDWLVIGSEFGGSVAALRLTEKGYRVGVLECGRRYEDSDFARSAWNLRRYFWAPRFGLRGIFRLTVFKDVFIASGVGGRRREPRLREHPLPRAAGFLPRPAVGRAG